MCKIKNPNDTAKNLADVLDEAHQTPEAGEAEASERPVEDVPVLAVRCDGRILVSTKDLSGIDRAGRETWEGLVLTEAEASDIHERLNFEEAAAPTVARLLALDKKAKAALATKAVKTDDDPTDDE